MTDDKTFSAVLKSARKMAGLSQNQLAKKSGVNRGAIAHYELGYHDPGTKVLRKLAKALGGVFYIDMYGWRYTPGPVLWSIA